MPCTWRPFGRPWLPPSSSSQVTLLLPSSSHASHSAAPPHPSLVSGRRAGYDPERHVLCDPMAGSGTIAIEAALMARRIAPGLLR
jgi:adenine-specific DNA methylase